MFDLGNNEFLNLSHVMRVERKIDDPDYPEVLIWLSTGEKLVRQFDDTAGANKLYLALRRRFTPEEHA